VVGVDDLDRLARGLATRRSSAARSRRKYPSRSGVDGVDLGSDEAKAVVARMRDMPIHDFFAERGVLRADGRMVHDMYLVEVKKPEESRYPWDYYKILKTIPGEEAFRPLNDAAAHSSPNLRSLKLRWLR
jgi:hypothetical protein